MTIDSPDAKEQHYLEILAKNWPPEEALARREEFGYDHDTCLKFGEFYLTAARQVYGKRQRLTRTLIALASKNDFGPSEHPIKENFGGALWRFNEELGSMYGFAHDRYETDDLLDIGHEIIQKYGVDKPGSSLFKKLFKEGKAPSPALLKHRFGSMGEYFKLLGFVDTRSMKPEDYPVWGADVYASGLGLELTSRNLHFMAARRRAPSDAAVVRNFGSLVDLQHEAKVLAATYSDEQREAAARKFGVLHLSFSNEDKNEAFDAAFSPVLRAVVIDGKPYGLSDNATVLLDLLFRHIDSPVYREDFFEEYRGKNVRQGDTSAFEELANIPYLAPHILKLEFGKTVVYGMTSRSHDTSLLTSRTLEVANYDASGFKVDSEQPRKHIKLIAISAAGAAVAAATVLVVRGKMRHN